MLPVSHTVQHESVDFHMTAKGDLAYDVVRAHASCSNSYAVTACSKRIGEESELPSTEPSGDGQLKAVIKTVESSKPFRGNLKSTSSTCQGALVESGSGIKTLQTNLEDQRARIIMVELAMASYVRLSQVVHVAQSSRSDKWQ